MSLWRHFFLLKQKLFNIFYLLLKYSLFRQILCYNSIMKKFWKILCSLTLIAIVTITTVCILNKEEKLTIKAQDSLTVYNDETNKSIDYSVSIAFANVEFKIENPEIISLNGAKVQPLTVGSTKVTLIAHYNKQIAESECVVTVLATNVTESPDNTNPNPENKPTPPQEDDKNLQESENKDKEENQSSDDLENPKNQDDKDNKDDDNTTVNPPLNSESDDNQSTTPEEPDDSQKQDASQNPNENEQSKTPEEENSTIFTIEIVNGNAEIVKNTIKLKSGEICFIHVFVDNNYEEIDITPDTNIIAKKVVGIFNNNFQIVIRKKGLSKKFCSKFRKNSTLYK